MNKLKAIIYIVVFLTFIIGSVFFISEAKKAIDMMKTCSGLYECIDRSLVSMLMLLSSIFILLFFTFISLIILFLAEKTD